VRPNEKPFVRLPILAEVSKELENCVYCPKLCRTTCPVSNAAPRETWTPGVKMSFAYHMARGDVGLEPDTIETAYACTGCHACQHACDHKNPVRDVLYQTRREVFARGYAPKSVQEADRAFHAREEGARERDATPRNVRYALAGGCGYDETTRTSAIRVASYLLGAEVAWIEQCCGKPLRAMGNERAFLVQQSRHASERKKYARVYSIDAGCSEALHTEGVPLLLMLARENLSKFTAQSTQQHRYHDTCALGRGLGIYQEPRALLAHLTGAPTEEFTAKEGRASCSGGGGLLPTTLPNVAAKAAAMRVSEHRELGGGTLVTSCASSLRSFKKAGASAVDLFELLAAAIPKSGAHNRS
jgi:Fe-S oxidoreductase